MNEEQEKILYICMVLVNIPPRLSEYKLHSNDRGFEYFLTGTVYLEAC